MSFIILSFSFGKPSTISSNVAIAAISTAIAKRFSVMMIGDRGVPFDDKDSFAFIGPLTEEEHESTYKLALRFAHQVVRRKNGWDKVIVVAAPDHMLRVKRDVREALKEKNINMKIYDWRDFIQKKNSSYVWYDKNSTQPWTRRRLFFLMREILLIGMPFRLYKKLTT